MIFNTDQGSQLTSLDFTPAVKRSGAAISMDGEGRFLDNIFVERLWRSLKYEEVYLKTYEDIKAARTGIADWIGFYNFDRPHQLLGYKTPWQVYHDRRLVPEGDTTAQSAVAQVATAARTVQVEEYHLDSVIIMSLSPKKCLRSISLAPESLGVLCAQSYLNKCEKDVKKVAFSVVRGAKNRHALPSSKCIPAGIHVYCLLRFVTEKVGRRAIS